MEVNAKIDRTSEAILQLLRSADEPMTAGRIREQLPDNDDESPESYGAESNYEIAYRVEQHLGEDEAGLVETIPEYEPQPGNADAAKGYRLTDRGREYVAENTAEMVDVVDFATARAAVADALHRVDDLEAKVDDFRATAEDIEELGEELREEFEGVRAKEQEMTKALDYATDAYTAASDAPDEEDVVALAERVEELEDELEKERQRRRELEQWIGGTRPKETPADVGQTVAGRLRRVERALNVLKWMADRNWGAMNEAMGSMRFGPDEPASWTRSKMQETANRYLTHGEEWTAAKVDEILDG